MNIDGGATTTGKVQEEITSKVTLEEVSKLDRELEEVTQVNTGQEEGIREVTPGWDFIWQRGSTADRNF